MSIEERMAEVLKAHVWYFVGNLGVPGMPDQRGYKCPCGWETHGSPDRAPDDPHLHVAAVLVAELGLTEEFGVTGTGVTIETTNRETAERRRKFVEDLLDGHECALHPRPAIISRFVTAWETAE